MMSQLNEKYCYINDALGEEFDVTRYRTEGDIGYLDADEYSEKLYNDWKKCLTYVQGECVNASSDKFSIEINGVKCKSDFIGVNRKSAYLANIKDLDIANYLVEQRTIGGHMFFPVGSGMSMNQARGNNLCDRFDYTLAEIKHYYDDIENNIQVEDDLPKYSKQLWNAILNYQEWLAGYLDKDGKNGFIRFIEYWFLEDFVNSNYEIISLVRSDIENNTIVLLEKNTKCFEPIFPGLTKYPKRVMMKSIQSNICEESENVRAAFQSYIKNSNCIIAKRSKRIVELCEKKRLYKEK